MKYSTGIFLGTGSRLPPHVVGKGKRWPYGLPCLAPIGAAHSVSGVCHALLRAPLRLVDAFLTFSVMLAGVSAIWGVAYLPQIGLLDREVLTVSLSLACPLITIAAFVAPTPMVIDAVQRMNASNLPTPVFQSQAACNVLGIAYGLQIKNSAVLITNMFGLACQILFLAGDHYVRASNAQWMWFTIKLSALFNTGIYFFARVAPINLLGQTITVFNIILYSSPLARLGSTLRSRNASAFSPALTGISVANNAFWTLYAILIEDIVVLLPSVLGYALSFFQVIVIFWCRGCLPFDLGFLLFFFRDRKESADSPSSSSRPAKDVEDLLPYRSPSKEKDLDEFLL